MAHAAVALLFVLKPSTDDDFGIVRRIAMPI